MSFTVAQVEFLDQNAEFVEYRRLFELKLLGETFRLAESEYAVTTSDGKVWQPAISLISAPCLASLLWPRLLLRPSATSRRAPRSCRFCCMCVSISRARSRPRALCNCAIWSFCRCYGPWRRR